MRLVFVSALLVACLLLSRVSCQLDCGLPTISDIENVIAGAIQSNDNPAAATVNVTNFRAVCRAYSVERNRYTAVSVIVGYTCEDNGNCPTGTVTEQFESSCVNGVWSHLVQNSPDNTRTQSPTASFSTDLREDCAFCLSPELAPNVGVPPSNTPDDENHCVSCVGCGENGQNRCTGINPEDCCSVYVDDMCDTDCPEDDDYVIDRDTAVCVLLPSCPNLDTIVENGEVMYSQSRLSSGRYSVGTIATVECMPGYRNSDITCQADGTWSSDLPSCTIIDCGNPPALDNGQIAMLDNTTVGSEVTYECNDNYYFDDGSKSSRTCLDSGDWSDEDIQCKACELPNCKLCEVVDGKPTCTDCNDNFELRDGGCDEACELPNCKSCEVVDGKPTCTDCNNDFERRDGGCDEISGGGSKNSVCILCIVIPLAILLAIILAVAVAVAVYVYYRWKHAPPTNLKEKDAEGINGVARDNPLYLDPSTVAEEVEE